MFANYKVMPDLYGKTGKYKKIRKDENKNSLGWWSGLASVRP
jgi:hypothetical protein